MTDSASNPWPSSLPSMKTLFDRYFPVRTEPMTKPSAGTISRAERLARPLAKYFRTEIHGLDRLPAGGALLVTNHGPLGFDSIELIFGIYRKTGRLPRGLAERLMFRTGWSKALLERLGHVAGTRENAVEALRGGDLVLVYPGGAREALKGTKHRYRLRWDKSLGFVRVAILAGVPIVPVAGLGVDDYYDVVREPDDVADTWFGRGLASLLGSEKYTPPSLSGLGPLPHPAKLEFVVGEPFDPGGDPGLAEDADHVRKIRDTIRERLERMMLSGMIRRDHPRWG